MPGLQVGDVACGAVALPDRDLEIMLQPAQLQGLTTREPVDRRLALVDEPLQLVACQINSSRGRVAATEVERLLVSSSWM